MLGLRWGTVTPQRGGLSGAPSVGNATAAEMPSLDLHPMRILVNRKYSARKKSRSRKICLDHPSPHSQRRQDSSQPFADDQCHSCSTPAAQAAPPPCTPVTRRRQKRATQSTRTTARPVPRYWSRSSLFHARLGSASLVLTPNQERKNRKNKRAMTKTSDSRSWPGLALVCFIN